MKTVQIQVYKFSELNKDAKQRAINDWRNKYSKYDSDIYYRELIDSVKALANAFNLKIGKRYTDLKTDNIEDDVLNLSGIRLAKYIWNNYKNDIFKGKFYGKLVNTLKDGTIIKKDANYPAGVRHVKRYSKCILENDCVLTGVCYDYDILKPVYDFLKNPSANVTFADLINNIEWAISKCFNDIEDWTGSDEFIIDNIEANEYEFTENGKIF